MLKLVQCAKLMKIFKESVSRFKGTNEPVSYRREYDFAEKWEETNKVKYDRNDNLLLSANSACLALAILVMLHKVPLIWSLSIQQVFELQDSPSWLASAIIIIIADLLLKLYLQALETSKASERAPSSAREAALQMLGLAAGDLVTLLVLGVRGAWGGQSAWMLLLDLMAVVVQSVRFYEIYSSITIILITYKYKNYVNLIGFISKMLVVLHFFVPPPPLSPSSSTRSPSSTPTTTGWQPSARSARGPSASTSRACTSSRRPCSRWATGTCCPRTTWRSR